MERREEEYGCPEAVDLDAGTVLVAESPAMRRVSAAALKVASTDSTVLITGETGCGKGALAKFIHRRGSRRFRNFVAVDCGAIPDSLIEAELFGCSKGAYTGATRERSGFLEMAEEGTVFLDEVGEMNFGVQKKLLRLLEDRTFARLGEARMRRTGARIVAATNRDLEEESKRGLFRRDLFFRLRVIHIEIPPLRERREDIVPLALHFSKKIAGKFGVEFNGFDDNLLDAIIRYEWPGNVRELLHAIEYALTFGAGKKLGLRDMPEHIGEVLRHARAQPMPALCLKTTIDNTSRDYLEKLLLSCKGNVTRSARVAGLNRRQLHRLLKRYELDAEAFRRVGTRRSDLC